MRLAVGIVALLAAFAASAGPAAAAGEPDLVIRLPGEPTGSAVAPVFVDAYEEPGRLLYRFDAIIANQGGTLDLFRGASGGVSQAVWPDGQPTVAPKPDVTPDGPEVVDRSGFGSSFSYAYEKTHQHFHFSSAARYELVPEGGAARVSDKVGFCMFDSSGTPGMFSYSVRGAAGETWCGFNRPDQATVRMGLSPGGADLYSATRERQWVDITDLAAGPAVVRARANPLHCVLESDESNNETTAARQIPGVRVAEITGAGTVVLSGAVVAPEVPARRSGGCAPGAGSRDCYVWASASGPLRFTVVREPARGTVALAPGADGLHAVATYTGPAGEDSFEYVATDARGLTSKPATVRVSVPAAEVPRATAPIGEPVKLSKVRVVKRRGRWRVELRVSGRAILGGRLERRRDGRRTTFRLRTRALRPGAARMALGRLARGRYRVKLLVNGRVAATARFRVRF